MQGDRVGESGSGESQTMYGTLSRRDNFELHFVTRKLKKIKKKHKTVRNRNVLMAKCSFSISKINHIIS